MEKQRKYALMWRWSLITGELIALFWAIWYLTTGSVPMVTSIKMTPEWTWQLPFGISRWWDILIGPIWPIILISLFTNERITKDEELVVGLAVGLVVGLVVGLPFGLVFSLPFGLAAFIKWVCSKNFWKAIKNWLLARNIKAEKI